MFPVILPVPVWSWMPPLMSVHADNWNYQPMTEWGEGDLHVEGVLKRDVATPGRQIGILTEAILESSDRLSRTIEILVAEDCSVDPQKTRTALESLKSETTEAIDRLRGLKKMVDDVREREGSSVPLREIKPIKAE